MQFDSTSTSLAVGDAQFQVRIFNVVSGEVTSRWAHPDVVSALNFSPDGKRLAVGGQGNGGAVYSVSDGKVVYEVKARSLGWAKDGRTIVAASGTGALSLVDAASGKVRATTSTKPHLPYVSTDSLAHVIATWNGQEPSIRLWSKTLKPLKGFESKAAGASGIAALVVAGSGRCLAAVGLDGIVRLWDVESRLERLARPVQSALAVAMSPDEKWLAATDGAELKLWPIEGECDGGAGALDAGR
jgi:WD40 repeat protein